MIETFISISARMIIGLVFFFSFITKIKNITSFQKTINKFKLLPEWTSIFVVYLALTGEFVIIVTMIVGWQLLAWGFILAALMLSVFSVALLSVIVRKIDTACNCFGLLENDRVSPYEIVRNTCFILCAIIGYFVHPTQQLSYTSSLYIYSLSGLSALVLVAIMINIKTVLGLFTNQ